MKREFKIDLDVFIKCCQEAGVHVEHVENGKGGIFINGERVDDIKKVICDVLEIEYVPDNP